MPRLQTQAGLIPFALWILSAAPSPGAEPAVIPKELAASLSLDHYMRDMMTVDSHRYELSITLRSEPSGAVQLRLQGTLAARESTITLKPSDKTPPARNSNIAVDERWSGSAHLEQDALVVDFERWEARPPLAVHVVWRCTPATISVADKPLAAWLCQTKQSITATTGAGHAMPAYLQVPMYLAPPAARLRVEALGHGGADHRSTLDHARYSRLP